MRHDGRLEVVPGLVLHHQAVEQRLRVADGHPRRQRERLALRHRQAEQLVGAQVHRRAHRDRPDVAVQRLARRAVTCAGKGTSKEKQLMCAQYTAARTTIDQMSQVSASPALSHCKVCPTVSSSISNFGTSNALNWSWWARKRA